jgi:hypothetical protein
MHRIWVASVISTAIQLVAQQVLLQRELAIKVPV